MPKIVDKVENENRGKVSNKYRVALKRFYLNQIQNLSLI